MTQVESVKKTLQTNLFEYTEVFFIDAIMVSELVVQHFLDLTNEYNDLCMPVKAEEIDVENLSPLTFYRNYVSTNQPVLIRNACRHWPAIKKWNKEYFQRVIGHKKVTVAVTPNGYADAVAEKDAESDVKEEYFVMPEERTMTISEFIDVLKNPNRYNGIFYIQKQNSNLPQEFPELIDDVSLDISWATETFGNPPDAINLWMGDERAITSLHKDPYENIYCVVSGYKDFILYPPTNRPWLRYKTYPIGMYKETSPGIFEIIPKDNNCDHIEEDLKTADETRDSEQSCEELKPSKKIPWICVDPLSPKFDEYPLYKNATPLHIRINAGDALFLPSLWFHHVRQSHSCIAVNYWYDMQYDAKYTYFQFMESLVKKFLEE